VIYRLPEKVPAFPGRTDLQKSIIIHSCAAFLLALTAFSPRVFADHTSIGIGTGSSSPIATESAATLPKGKWSVGVRTEFIDFDEFSDQQLQHFREVDEDGDIHSVRSILNVALAAFYGVTDDLTVGVKLPYVWRSNIREPEHGHGDEGEDHGDDDHEDQPEIENLGDSNGLGDLVLFGQYRFFQVPEKQNMSVLLGVKTPTGSTSETADNGETFETDLQPGSGSWDGLFGLAYTHWFGAWAFDGSLLYSVVTEGAQDSDLGDVFDYNLALSYRLGGGPPAVFYQPRDKHALDFVLELNGEWRDSETIGDTTNNNSGGHVLYVSPGVRYVGTKNWSLGASVGIPALTDLNGIQVEPDYRILGTLIIGL